jgi:hypothetical protein
MSKNPNRDAIEALVKQSRGEENPKRGFSFGQKVVALGAGASVLVTNASAAITAPDFSGPIADVGILLGAMIAFGAIVWGSRKLLGFIK